MEGTMGEAVTLREVHDEDLAIFFQHQGDPESNRMAAFPARDQAAFDAHWARIRADSRIVVRTIVVDGQVAGNLVSFEQGGAREVGYWLGREFWGRGIATSALTQFLQLVTVRPLHAVLAPHNVASRRVLEKCGFRFEIEEGDELRLMLPATPPAPALDPALGREST
jgi:RimJ/RimL family protein N-acetyltransferase